MGQNGRGKPDLLRGELEVRLVIVQGDGNRGNAVGQDGPAIARGPACRARAGRRRGPHFGFGHTNLHALLTWRLHRATIRVSSPNYSWQPLSEGLTSKLLNLSVG